ncbi:ABC transporter ATP-binding protein [Ancylobacter sp. IITR112]|uniref:ABC transporter ATP-binding protein n=1 Tax=Ancylobacter sp. IITR112 TaxID=3138073 RepID=UPI00352A53A0
MAGTNLLHVEHAERHLSDGQRESNICLRDIELRAGAVYGLCGPSGIGKTTALEMLSLASVPDVFGAMSVKDGDRRIDIAALMARGQQEKLAALRGRLFGYVVQTSRLLPFLTVRDNIRLSQNIAALRDEAFIDQLMERLLITPLAGAYPAALSGGQRQRVSIARALAHRPAVVLADEPTSAVDQEIAAMIIRLLIDYAGALGAAVLVITHNVELAQRFQLVRLDVESRSAGRAMHTVIGRAGAERAQRAGGGAL